MKVKRKLLSVFLVISMLAGILPLTALPVYAANPPATDVSVYTTEGNQTLDSMYPYLVNGKKAKTGTLGSGGCTAYFDHTTGILTLQNHSGGSIVKGSLGGKKDLTVKLVGTNALTSALQNISGGDLIITAEDTATLSITNNTDTNGVITGISTDITGVNAGPGSITIRGKANISIYVENISTGVESGVRGIFAKQDISILDNASVNIECIGKGTGSYPVSGIQSTNKSVTFNTTGKVNIDCSDAQNKNPYAINNMLANILTSVDELTLKWTNGGRGYSLVDGGMSYDVTSFTRNIKEATPTQPGIEVFKKGTPLTLTIENGKNNFGKKEGQFTHGETVNVTANSITGLTFKKWVATAGIIGCATDSSTTLTMPDENVTLTAIYDVFAVQPKSAYVSATSRKVTFSLKATPTTYAPRLVTESGDYNDIVGETTFGHDGALNYSEVIRCIGIFDVPNGNYRIAAKFDDVWYYSDVFTVDYSTHSITVDGDAVETTDYTITGVSDFSSIPDGTNLTINAVNDINVDGENVVAGSSKTIVINSSYTITINKKVSNSAPTVVVGKETQTGNATPKASSGIPAAIAYEADMSGWFNDADGDALTYSVVSAREGTNDVSAHVSVAGKHITYTPAAAQAGKNVIIKIKANDGLADSTGNVTITVSVAAVPADTTYKVTIYGNAVITTDYTVSVADLNAVPHGTDLIIYAVNDITVSGEDVAAGGSKTIASIISPYNITVNKKTGNNAPTVVVGKETQTGNATPKANCGHPEAVRYEADMSGWFNDVDGDTLTYSVVSATEGANDVSAHVSVAGKHITYTPAAAQAGKNVIIKIKANDGLADSTGNVTITVSVAAVPADTTYKVTIYGNAVITTDYTVSVADLNAVPHGTDLIIYAVNDITVSGEDVAAGGSKTIASIISPYNITVNKKTGNNAPTVVVGKETQTGNATPKANCGHPEAVRYEADMSGWFNDVDGDTLTYSVVSATEGANDVSAHVSVAGKHITYTPAAAQAGKNVIIKIKANDGLADSTGNVTITVSVAAVPADTTYKVTIYGNAVITTDYTVSVADLNAVPHGTDLIIYAVNDITVSGEDVAAGGSKTIASIISPYNITVNKKTGNNAPTVVVGKETQTGNATPKANCGHPEAVRYEADMSGWFNDVDGDTLTYSVVSATEGANDVSAHVSVAGKHITYTPAAAQAGKNVIIKIKANDGLADSTGNVTITVSVAAVPADTTYKVTIYGNAVITTDYTVSVADLNAVPHGTDLIIYAVNDITVSGEDVAAGGSKTIASIISPYNITVNKKTGNNAPTVVVGKETQTGNATPKANCGHPEAVRYEADMSGWFNDVDGDTLTYSVVSATEGANDVSAHVSVAGKHITYTPAAAQAGKNVIIKIKANDGLADSTGNVTITVSVAAVPADTTYKVTIYGNAVITTDYTVSVADLNAVPHGTDLIIYAVNDITVSGEDVAAGGSKTIASIISPYNITVNKKTGNNAPTVVVGKETQTGNATPKANCGHPEAVRYEADMSGWFNDVDGDTLTYSVVSATEGANDVSAHVSVAGKHITYTPAAAQAGKNVIIKIKANDGLADSTGNVTITVSVAAVPADTTYKVTIYGNAVITTDYTVSVADLNAVPHGTNLTINAVNNIIVDGESVAAGGSKVITINSSQTITVNKVAIPKHTVTYDVDGGSLAAPTQDDVAEGATFAVASYAGTKAGFTFGGWNDGSSDYVAGAVYTMGTLNVTLTAVWNVASIAVTGVKLDSSTLTLTAGGSAGTLTATVLPMDAANKNITWASSDTSTATVSNGVVTPVAAGTATITVTTEDGGKTATCTVKVVPAKPTGLVAIKPTTAGGTDGMITGTSAIMEYANNVSFTGAVNCIGTKITNLSAGTYYVRVKATVAHDAGEAATVVVPAFVAIEEEDEDIYIPVTSPTIPANNGAVNIGYIESEGVVSLDLTDDKIEEIIKKSSKGNVDFNVSGIENATSVEIPKEAFKHLVKRICL